MQKINCHQKSLYEKYDFAGSQRYLDRYKKYLEDFSSRDTIQILDIGGASGYFAYLLKEHFAANAKVTVYVVDPTEYDSWAKDQLGSDIVFIQDSVENISTLFPESTFDLVFANRVFHHFVHKSYRKTLRGMDAYLLAIKQVLKPDGQLCIMDHFYNGAVVDSAASRLIYTYTSIKNPKLASVIKKLGAMTAGVGVCFQSEKMWVKRVTKCGFHIKHIDYSAPDKFPVLKKIGLLCKKMSRNNLILAVPEK